ncbi:MAG: 50S ribosomal protein L6 [Pseudomonadota bacterium]
MSRIGKQPIEVPKAITASVDGGAVKVKGPKGELSFKTVEDVSVSFDEGVIQVTPKDDSKRSRAMWGMQRTLIANMIEGVSNGFTKELEINGVGYRAQMKGKDLQLNLGFSHDVIYKVPDGVQIATPKPTEVTISGADKQLVGQVASEIRSYRPPEPYKGKGVKYKDEFIFRKEGKKK